ncbi:rhomboid family intramembrane serine protease [Marinimicrobium agarilyticum]|uniref:rhomboid family intramembrane serine protease n=1 Tax=Marinimicrobium agarilyticum TaxID=306546 RepID=UPI00040BAE10|nr:rhomboid family intramembrane serine protease [Marinimicrobium agarilyticum]
MNWIPVKQLPLDRDLTELSRFLHQRGLVHRITDEGQHQEIWVQDPAMVDPLGELTDRWLKGEVELPEGEQPRRTMPKGPSPRQFPATVVLLLLSAAGALIGMQILGGALVPYLTFQPVGMGFNGPEFGDWGEAMASGEFWRLLTPAFLHFSMFHILFNGLWIWELGRRLEAVLGPWRYLLFVVVTAIAANLGQFLAGPSVFGGMSGVVYALIGYLWMRQRFNPHPMLAVPPGIIGFMLVWLVICMTGIVDKFIGGSVANGAHLGGLVAGVVWGILSSGRRVS